MTDDGIVLVVVVLPEVLVPNVRKAALREQWGSGGRIARQQEDGAIFVTEFGGTELKRLENLVVVWV